MHSSQTCAPVGCHCPVLARRPGTPDGCGQQRATQLTVPEQRRGGPMIAMFPPSQEPRDNAWSIVVDHLFDGSDPEPITQSEAGTYGPRPAPDGLVDALDRRSTEAGQRAREARGIRTTIVKTYDDRGEFQHAGFLAYRILAEDEEHVVAGPLADFALPNAGCSSIECSGHPDWAVG